MNTDQLGLDYAMRLLANTRWTMVTHAGEIQRATRTPPPTESADGPVTLPSPAELATEAIFSMLKRNGLVEELEDVSYSLRRGICGTQAHVWIRMNRPLERRRDPIPASWIVDPYPPGIVGGPLLVAPDSPFKLFYRDDGGGK